MAGNSIGTFFRVTTWGESHGPAIGAVIDGCPAGLDLDSGIIQKDLDRRRVGQSQISSQRKEADTCQILSGVFEGKTTGAPVHVEIQNTDSDSRSYENIKNLFRPGHADYTYAKKYGIRDWRGGGRSSARETACRVAAGAIARKFLSTRGIAVFAHTIQIHDIKAQKFEKETIEQNDIRCADPDAAAKMMEKINKARKDGDSVGGVVEVCATGVPAGLGEPVYDRFDADLAKSLMSVNAVKGVEIGSGFSSAGMFGSANNDSMRMADGAVAFESNNSGGIDGGITNGNIIVARIAVKPTPSILKEQITVDTEGNDATISVQGRHDPCICPRAVAVAEAMMCLTLADHLLRNRSARV
ncbi:Chorismate synthase [hydrothermal vent metagenome]|uniref:chorismate synthase n=1 Tax=hydrothermal vent metagenome TaxID=652676 RepID=A0A3B1CC21_9ZZZZ